MVKIRIISSAQTDVTDLRAKGWHVLVFRGTKLDDDFITFEKKDIRFVVKIGEKDGNRVVEIFKFIDGHQKDEKQFFENGCGINGTYWISEGKTNELTYMFYRNEKLQTLIDEFGIRRVVFPKDPGEKFEKDVYLDIEKAKRYSGTLPEAPSFHTDGTYEEVGTDVKGTRKWHVTDASYIYEYNTLTLTIPQVYDTEKIRELLDELTQ